MPNFAGAEHQKSIFAPSRRAAQQIMEDKAKPVFFETTDEARVRDHLVNNCGLTNDQVTEAMDGYKIINTAKRMLRIQP